MKEKDTPHNQEGQAPTRNPKETAQRLEQKANEQEGESNRALTEEKAREARDDAEASGGSKGREVRFGG
jgi:hypothetical protein